MAIGTNVPKSLSANYKIGFTKLFKSPVRFEVYRKLCASMKGLSDLASSIDILRGTIASCKGSSSSSGKIYLDDQVLLIDGSESVFCNNSLLNHRILYIDGLSFLSIKSSSLVDFEIYASGLTRSQVYHKLFNSLFIKVFGSSPSSVFLSFRAGIYTSGETSSSMSCSIFGDNLIKTSGEAKSNLEISTSRNITISIDGESIASLSTEFNQSVKLISSDVSSLSALFVSDKVLYEVFGEEKSSFSTRVFIPLKLFSISLLAESRGNAFFDDLLPLILSGVETSIFSINPKMDYVIFFSGCSRVSVSLSTTKTHKLLAIGESISNKDIYFSMSMLLKNILLPSAGKASIINTTLIERCLTQSNPQRIRKGKKSIKEVAKQQHYISPNKLKDLSKKRTNTLRKKTNNLFGGVFND